MSGSKQGGDTTYWKMDCGRLSKIRKKEIRQLQYSRKEMMVVCPSLEQVERNGLAWHVKGTWCRVNHIYWIGGGMTPTFEVEKQCRKRYSLLR